MKGRLPDLRAAHVELGFSRFAALLEGVPPRQRTAGLQPGRRRGHFGRNEASFREETEVIDFFAPPREDFLLGGKPALLGGKPAARAAMRAWVIFRK